MPKGRMGPPLRSFAADAYDLHHGSGPWTHRIQGCGATDPRPKAGSPLIVIPIAPSVPSCSKLSRYGLARAGDAARWARGPTLSAPGGADASEPPGGGREEGHGVRDKDEGARK